MAPTMQFKEQFCAMYPSRTQRENVLSAHVHTLARGTELFCVYSVGTEGAIVTAWEEDQRHSSHSRDVEYGLPPITPPPITPSPTYRSSTSYTTKDYSYTGGPVRLPAAPGEALFRSTHFGKFVYELPISEKLAIGALTLCAEHKLSIPRGMVAEIIMPNGSKYDLSLMGAPDQIDAISSVNDTVLDYFNFKLKVPLTQPGPAAPSIHRNTARRNSPGKGLVPTDIGWGEIILMPSQNVASVATAYLNGLKSNQKLIWLSPWLLGSPIPFMWPAVFDMPKMMVVSKYRGKAYMIREKRKNWFVPIINGWEFKEWGNKDLYMLMLFLEQVA